MRIIPNLYLLKRCPRLRRVFSHHLGIALLALHWRYLEYFPFHYHSRVLRPPHPHPRLRCQLQPLAHGPDPDPVPPCCPSRHPPHPGHLPPPHHPPHYWHPHPHPLHCPPPLPHCWHHPHPPHRHLRHYFHSDQFHYHPQPLSVSADTRIRDLGSCRWWRNGENNKKKNRKINTLAKIYIQPVCPHTHPSMDSARYFFM